MLHRGQVVEQPACQAAHPLRDGLVADGLDVPEPDLESRDVEIIQRAVFEGGRAVSHVVFVTLHGGDRDGPAREPGTVQFGQRLLSGDQRAQPGGIPEDLVERDGQVIRVDFRQIKAAGGDVGRRIEQHVPARFVGPGDPFQRMLDAREVGLGWVSEQVAPPRFGARQVLVQP